MDKNIKDDSEVARLTGSLTGDSARDLAALSALADMAKTSQDALLSVVEHFPRPTRINPDHLSPELQIRRRLAESLTHCVPGLITILETSQHHLESRETGARTDAYYDAVNLAERTTEILGEIGAAAQTAVPALIRAMHANPRGVGEFAGQVLGQIGGETAIRELNGVWFSGWDRKLCDSCHSGLAKLGAAAHPTLLRIVNEADSPERARALLSLRVADYGETDLAALAFQLIQSDSDQSVQETAIGVLHRIFDQPEKAELVLPMLKEIWTNPSYSESIRLAAALAVQDINETLARWNKA